jgi:PAS domain S-box-containing protein
MHIFKKNDNDYVLVDYNEAANKILRGKLEDYLGSRVSELFRDRPKVISSFKDCYENKTLVRSHFTYFFKNIDELKHVVVEFQFIDPDFILVHYEDITKRKLAQEELKNSRAKYHSLFKHSPLGIAIFNKEGTLIDCNPMSEKITGYTRAELINRNFKDFPLFSPQYFSLFNKNIKSLEKAQRSELSEIQIKKKNNSYSWILYQISSFDLDGVPYYQCIFQDINALKITEKNLEDSKESYQNLIESVPDLILKIKPKGTILFASPQVKELLGYTSNSLIGTSYFDLIHPADIGLFKNAQKKAIETGDPISLEYRIKKLDGSYLPVGGRGKLINDQGKLRLLGVIRDISDKKTTEKLLEEKLELESLISNLSSRFIFTDDFNEALQNSLKELADFINANRSYIFLFDEDKAFMSNSHEWCAPDVEPQIDQLQNIPLNHFPWLIKRLEEGNPIHVTKSAKIFSEIKSYFKFFETDFIKSILMFPIFLNEELSGFLGFDGVEKTQKWNQKDLSIFQIAADIIGTSLERRLTEKTLTESHNFLDGIISSIPNLMCIIDPEYRLIWINDKTQNMYKENIIGKHCYNVFRNSDEVCKNCPAERTFKTGKMHQQEIEYLYKKDDPRIISTNSNVISKSVDGEAELVVIIGQDITQFKKTEKEFLEAKRKYQFLFEQADHGILIFDPDLNEIVDFNKKAHNSLGFTREEFEHEFNSFSGSKILNDSFQSHFNEVKKNKKDAMTIKIRNKQGNTIDVAIFSHLFTIGKSTYIQSLLEFDPQYFDSVFKQMER